VRVAESSFIISLVHPNRRAANSRLSIFKSALRNLQTEIYEIFHRRRDGRATGVNASVNKNRFEARPWGGRAKPLEGLRRGAHTSRMLAIHENGNVNGSSARESDRIVPHSAALNGKFCVENKSSSNEARRSSIGHIRRVFPFSNFFFFLVKFLVTPMLHKRDWRCVVARGVCTYTRDRRRVRINLGYSSFPFLRNRPVTRSGGLRLSCVCDDR